jgi:branched-chain amino acid aminotransferase
MRETVIEHLKKQGISVHEKGIAIEDLLAADEVFLTDVINGIRWVGAFRNKRFFNNFSRNILREINENCQIKKV